MRLLLDTHIAIWALTSPRRLTQVGRDLIADQDSDIHISVASIWEIAIKHALGRIGAPEFSAAAAVHYFTEFGFSLLDVTAAHAVAVETLPLLHDDPFDRLIIAQAFSEPMRLLTHDRQVAAYSDHILFV